ncbi:MAG: DoxX family protein [Nanoarchaeota archaeon]|mgnify:CR=1 FL=1
MLNSFGKKHGDKLYAVARFIVGALFFQHGAQKIFGLLGGSKVGLASFIGVAGIIELVAGIAIAAGIFTRLAAGIAASEMLVAFFKAHFKFSGGLAGWVPIMNGGELALLFLAAFLVILAYGAGKCSLEKTFK